MDSVLWIWLLLIWENIALGNWLSKLCSVWAGGVCKYADRIERLSRTAVGERIVKYLCVIYFVLAMVGALFTYNESQKIRIIIQWMCSCRRSNMLLYIWVDKKPMQKHCPWHTTWAMGEHVCIHHKFSFYCLCVGKVGRAQGSVFNLRQSCKLSCIYSVGVLLQQTTENKTRNNV